MRIDFAVVGLPLLGQVAPAVIAVADLVERDGRLVELVITQAGDRADAAEIVRAVAVKPLLTNQALTLRHESVGKKDDEHDVSLKPFIGTLRVIKPVR